MVNTTNIAACIINQAKQIWSFGTKGINVNTNIINPLYITISMHSELMIRNDLKRR